MSEAASPEPPTEEPPVAPTGPAAACSRTGAAAGSRRGIVARVQVDHASLRGHLLPFLSV